jgi:hypothetical protein
MRIIGVTYLQLQRHIWRFKKNYNDSEANILQEIKLLHIILENNK